MTLNRHVEKITRYVKIYTSIKNKEKLQHKENLKNLVLTKGGFYGNMYI